jgi:hypothetical protein
MAQRRVGGPVQFQINGEVYRAKGNFTYNAGRPMREAILGNDTVHGYKETPQVAFVEGEITDAGDVDLAALVSTTDATVTLELANGKMFVLRDAWFAGEGTGNSEEGNIAVRFEGASGEEVPAND